MKTKLKLSPFVRRANGFTDARLICGQCGRECKSVMEFMLIPNPDIISHACMDNHHCVNETLHAMEAAHGLNNFTMTELKYRPIRYKIGLMKWLLMNYMRDRVKVKYRRFFGIWEHVLTFTYDHHAFGERGQCSCINNVARLTNIGVGDKIWINVPDTVNTSRMVEITRCIFNVAKNSVQYIGRCDDFNPKPHK